MMGAIRDQLVLFSHIPETAGWSLCHEFLRVFKDRSIVVDGHMPLKAAVSRRTDAGLAALALVGGHARLDEIEEALAIDARDHFCVTLLRDVLRRAVSYYLFILRNIPLMAPVRDLFVGRSFEYCVEHSADTRPELIVKAQCRYLCGRDDAEAAMHAIEERYHLVALTDCFPEFYARIRDQTGGMLARWEAEMAVNVAPPARHAADVARGRMPADIGDLVTPRGLRRLEAVAAADFELLERFAARRGGYFERPAG